MNREMDVNGSMARVSISVRSGCSEATVRVEASNDGDNKINLDGIGLIRELAAAVERLAGVRDDER